MNLEAVFASGPSLMQAMVDGSYTALRSGVPDFPPPLSMAVASISEDRGTGSLEGQLWQARPAGDGSAREIAVSETCRGSGHLMADGRYDRVGPLLDGDPTGDECAPGTG